MSSVAAVEEEEAEEAEGDNSSAEEGELVGGGAAPADINVSEGGQGRDRTLHCDRTLYYLARIPS